MAIFLKRVGLILAVSSLGFGIQLAPVSLGAAGRDAAKEAVTNLEAYAAYKMGQYAKARSIWEGLAAKGNTTALINLANLFQQGQGVSEDQKRALDYVKRA